MKRQQSPVPPWAYFTWASWRLALDVQEVMALRLARIGAGGVEGYVEAMQMVSEKFAAAAEGQMLLLRAGQGGRSNGPQQVLGLYRRRVAANKRRLGRG